MSSKDLPTNYAGHEALYRRRRDAGGTGWDSEEVTAENIEKIDRLLTRVSVAQAGPMLELGCGAGNLTSHFAKLGWKAHGVDISPSAIEWARERAVQQELTIDYRVNNVLKLDCYADASFDLVLDGHCFHCIIGSDRKVFLEEARRVLRATGTLLIMTMAGAFPKNFLGSGVLDEETRCQIIDGVATRYFGDAEPISAEVAAAGFQIRHTELVPRASESDSDMLLLVAT
jgi:ubiquinone/menaquinone biosynthesis C-methylase UbiE